MARFCIKHLRLSGRSRKVLPGCCWYTFYCSGVMWRSLAEKKLKERIVVLSKISAGVIMGLRLFINTIYQC